MQTCKRCFSWLPSWDSLLSYNTVKIVAIRDRRLGLLHYFFMLCIVGYIVGYVIVYDKRYLKLEAPVGSVRMSLLSPQNRGETPPPASELPYCLQMQKQYNGWKNHRCLYWDEALVVFPPTEASAMFITTRVTNITEHLDNCTLDSNTCKYIADSVNTSTIAAIENFTLLIDHSVYTSQLGIQANSEELPGCLLGPNGKEMVDPFKEDSIGRAGAQDIIHLSVLLEAAGINSLDTVSPSNSSRSKRYDGVVLLVFITYSNTYTYDTRKLRYQYTVKMVEDTKYKVVQPVYTKQIDVRAIWNRHGIRLLVLQVGMLGAFDFETMLLSFVSGLGLLAVATLVVDTIAIRLLPKSSRIYKRYKYLETPEYNSLEGEDIGNEEEKVAINRPV